MKYHAKQATNIGTFAEAGRLLIYGRIIKNSMSVIKHVNLKIEYQGS